MPRLVHLPLALEGAIKVHLISKIRHIIYETLSISQNSSYSQGWFISDVENPQYIRNPTTLLQFLHFTSQLHKLQHFPPDSQVKPNQQPRLLKKLERPDGSTRLFFLCPKQNWCSLQYYTGHYYFQTAQIDRGALCLKKISSINQCIMDVEQIS